jgi:hypothetical protein
MILTEIDNQKWIRRNRSWNTNSVGSNTVEPHNNESDHGVHRQLDLVHATNETKRVMGPTPTAFTNAT